MLVNRVAELLEAPDAPLVIKRAQAVLNAEADRRQAFREWLSDDINSDHRPAEFINGEVSMHSPVKRRHLNADTLTSLTVTGFQIPVRAIFNNKANLSALRELMK